MLDCLGLIEERMGGSYHVSEIYICAVEEQVIDIDSLVYILYNYDKNILFYRIQI